MFLPNHTQFPFHEEARQLADSNCLLTMIERMANPQSKCSTAQLSASASDAHIRRKGVLWCARRSRRRHIENLVGAQTFESLWHDITHTYFGATVRTGSSASRANEAKTKTATTIFRRAATALRGASPCGNVIPMTATRYSKE